MIEVGYVIGNKTAAKEVVIGKTTVYIHDDIKKIEIEDELGNPIDDLYSYHEIQYDKDEYLNLVMQENHDLKKSSQISASDITDIQLALTEIYESLL